MDCEGEGQTGEGGWGGEAGVQAWHPAESAANGSGGEHKRQRS